MLPSIESELRRRQFPVRRTRSRPRALGRQRPLDGRGPLQPSGGGQRTRRQSPLPRRRRLRRARRRPIGVRRPIFAPPPVAQGSEYMRWVQHTLNQVMDAQLPVNGIVGPKTRSAIRAFQQRQGLPETGIVGPQTEKALTTAVSSQEPPANGNGGGSEPAAADDAATAEEVMAWQSEINRQSRDYIRWVQKGLNKILGLRLVEDGILGPKTRSAVRSFQQKQGLLVDGIVGPQTESALIRAGAGQPAGSGSPIPLPPSYGPPSPSQPSPGTHSLRRKVAQLATQEWERWGRGSIRESDPRIRPVLEDYWRTGVGWLPSSSTWWSSAAWSAAFISWIMRKAGAGSAFRYSSLHTDYVGEAKRNRLANNSNPFKAYDIREVAPRVGDLVCRERGSSGVTYDNVDKGQYSSHCDIVTEVRPGEITTIGGNRWAPGVPPDEGVTVNAGTVRTDNTNGKVIQPGYYAVVRVGA
jgi:peptidoglycan hydrolase-like protein with peptidoglycan-binding domain